MMAQVMMMAASFGTSRRWRRGPSAHPWTRQLARPLLLLAAARVTPP